MAAAQQVGELALYPSPEAGNWRRQAVMQRRTAAMLGPLEHEGYLVLHDVTLPGWLDSLDHVVVGPTGVWVVASCRRRRLLGRGGAVPAGILRGLRAQATGWPRCWTAGPRSRSGRCCACAAPGWEPWRRSRAPGSRARGVSPTRTERIEGGARRHRSSRRPLAQGTAGGGLTPDQKRGVGQPPLFSFSAIFSWASARAAFRALTWCPSASPTTLVMARVTAGSTFSAAERG